ncbi:hypothetical protein ADU37_CDS06910 [Thermococcus sp. 2319x1]|uniref:NifB/NifX family molybdenum-iron cluster-binding protein n=1 Tax=Thermococcus sp. 2319x1 TaxID=1674923 RepID=UPI00073A701A|nr:NifB/NifX family molybdenum-iron cluster-binding protein [Thermococcus sp. 2319x1]ALV62390.1 hypothetical protein ADU37_CDS06910 [Thermococcus sp. 2319x1]
MRVAVATITGGLEDFVNQHFGRTPTFTIADVEDGEIKSVRVVPNPGASAQRGAGVQAAQFCIDEGVDVVIAGQLGPTSSQVLQKSGIKFVSAPPTMKVEEAIRAFLRED